MKTACHYVLAAAAAMFISGGLPSAFADGNPPSAKATALGGDCCADLEERVAELEVTTARKGNRKVSLEVSGQVDRALLIWNDGKNSDAYVVDNSYSSTRFRLRGTGQMSAGWKAGFFLEPEFRDAASNTVSQFTETGGHGTDFSTGSIRLRQSNVFVESEKWGRVTFGLQNMATKDLTLINLGGGMNDPENYFATAFALRGSNGAVSTLIWNNFSNALDAQRAEVLRYDTPSIYGFIASASWGQNDVWDTALRYQNEWNSIRIAGGVGYAWYGENFCGNIPNNTTANGTCQPDGATIFQVPNEPNFPIRGRGTKTEVVSGDISLLHIPTGVYVTIVAATRHFDNPGFDGLVPNQDASYIYTQLGITKRFFDVGATTFYGEFGDYSNFAVGDIDIPLLGAGRIRSDDVTRWGVGFTQAYDGAATEIFTNYLHYSADITTNLGTKPTVEDWDAVVTGARLKF